VKIVVDTNILFSALLNSSGKIADLLLNSYQTFEFLAPGFILDELEKHRGKLLKLSGYSDENLTFLIRIVLKKIEIIDLEIISPEARKKSIEITSEIDEFDAPFVALCLEIGAPLWTGDKKLINGLKTKGIPEVLDTAALTDLRNKDD